MAERSYSKPSPDELRSRLGSLEYEVTQHDATEPPFRNRFWDNHEAGLYVDIASGEPLFSSTDKFDSGTGWPSFWKPVDPENVVDRADVSHGYRRVEVRSKHGDSHLGHVFEDGPRPTGLRYCINSASLRFIPVAQLEVEGYGEYRALFGDGKATHQEVVDHDNACAVPKPGEAPSCEATVEEAILAGGCFWGMEDILGKIPGVIESEVGYAGGSTAKPTYEQVRTGKTGHAESIRILFDPKRISFEDLLDQWFFKMHDPTSKNQQGNDRGSQYRSAIFVTSPAQREAAARAVRKAQESGRWRGRPVVTEIVDAGTFTPAEDYHQKYLDKHPGGYTCHFMRD